MGLGITEDMKKAPADQQLDCLEGEWESVGVKK
jgi:hypothetical protein